MRYLLNRHPGLLLSVLMPALLAWTALGTEAFGHPFDTGPSAVPAWVPMIAAMLDWDDMSAMRMLHASQQALPSPPAALTLAARGIRFGGSLQADGSHVVMGGKPHAKPLTGQYLLDLSAMVDTGKLFGLTGGTVFVDGQAHGGSNILTTQMAAIQDPDNMDAAPTVSIDRAWYRQDFLGRKLQIQVGQMYVDDQFLTVPYGQDFLSLDFSSDASISTFVLPTYPKGSPGGDVFFRPLQGLYFSLGVFDDHSTELPYDPGGNLYISEAGWQGQCGVHQYKIQVGAWRDTGTFRRFRDGALHRNASGFYVVASGKLWQPSASGDRGLGVFLQLGTAPPSVAPVQRHIGAGLVWTGPFESRPGDEIGVAFSDGILTGQDGFVYGFEKEYEAYYRLQVQPGFAIQPDIEYWQHPNGRGANTLLFLVRFQYSFGSDLP